MSAESTRVSLLVTDSLERLSIAYAVEGFLANSDHRVERSSPDAGIVAGYVQRGLAALILFGVHLFSVLFVGISSSQVA